MANLRRDSSADGINPGRPMKCNCDMPTGCGSGVAFNAFRTVTFEAPKTNMIDSNGRLLPEVGDLFVVPVGWPEALDPGPGDLLRYPHPQPNQIKGDRGRVLIVGGGPYHGAPILAGMAAARMGVDLVHVAMPNNAALKAKWPNELIHEKISDDDILTDVSTIVTRCLTGRGVNAIVIGPGLGTDPSTIESVKLLLQSTPKIPKVIDADAIKALNGWPDDLIGIITSPKRLRNWIGNIENVPELVSNSGRKSGCHKDWPRGHYHRLRRRRGGIGKGGNPRMSMGGTGDLLAGCLGGLLGLGLSPWGASDLEFLLDEKTEKWLGMRLDRGWWQRMSQFSSRSITGRFFSIHQRWKTLSS